MACAEEALLRIDVVYCPRPGITDAVHLKLQAPATVAAALQASGLLTRHALDEGALQVGVWCRTRALDSMLRDLDRVEIYRPLTVDPKEARRLRYKRQRETRPL